MLITVCKHTDDYYPYRRIIPAGGASWRNTDGEICGHTFWRHHLGFETTVSMTTSTLYDEATMYYELIT